MKTNSIVGQFRVPIERIRTTWGDKPFSGWKEFKNPLARGLYESAQRTQNLNAKIRFLEQMGHYKVVNSASENELNNFMQRPLP